MMSHLKRWGILGAFTVSLAFLGCGEPGDPMAEPGPVVNDDFGASDPTFDQSPEFPAPSDDPGAFGTDTGAAAPEYSPPAEPIEAPDAGAETPDF